MKLLIGFLFLFTIAIGKFSHADPMIDPGVSGAISSSGAIAILNVQRSFKFGVQINSVVSGTVGTPTATLQGSNDCVTYFNLPIRATGDVTKSATLSSSGTFFLSEDNLEVNCVRVNYASVSGGGHLSITEIRKVHGPMN